MKVFGLLVCLSVSLMPLMADAAELEDVLKCPCGGRRRVVAVITKYDEARGMLKRMRVEVPPVKIRARDKGPPEDKQLKLAV